MFYTQMTKYSICLAALLILLHTLVQGIPEPQSGPLLLLSTTKDIRIIHTTKINNKIQKPITLVRNLTAGGAVDYHYAEKKLCWTDQALESIQCVTFNGVEIENKIEIVSNTVSSPDGLACDWLTNKLYWADSENNLIEMSTMTGQYRKVLFWVDIDQPRAIALVPKKGLMFWTDWGEVPKIERAGMNGDPATRSTIVSSNIFWPNGLTIDHEKELVYWIDAKIQYIGSIDYNGNNRKEVMSKGLVYPFALTYFQHKFYWTDWNTKFIYMFDTQTSKEPEVKTRLAETPMDIRVWDPANQPRDPHPCEKDNGGCSHLCLLAPYAPGYSCACPIGIKLINNMTCADGPQALLVLARRTDICIIYLDSPDYSYHVIPLDIKYAIAIDYDPVNGYIYWTDDTAHTIQRARLNGSDQQDVITDELKHSDGIAVDWVSRNLYWTDVELKRIEVLRLETNYRKVIISEVLYQPRAIAVAPELGWLFWTDWYTKGPKIERSNLDGSERIIIVSTDLGWPNGVTLDLDKQKVYWCDAKTDKIEFANMDGTDRRELLNENVPHAFGFSLMGDYLYWTDWQMRTIERAHKETGGNREVIIEQANIMGVKAINITKVTGGWNLCSENNGGCSHICLYRHNKTRICACQWEFELEKDRVTCREVNAYLLYAKNNSISRMSIVNPIPENEMRVPITELKYASKIDVDIQNNRIYWSDTQSRAIASANTNGSSSDKSVEIGLVTPEGIAVDWVAYNIYWTDPAARKIEVARLKGSSRRVLIWRNVDEPHSIALNPRFGYMYWTEWGKLGSIKRAALDGSQQFTLVTTTGDATGLTLDAVEERMYWIELNSGNIMSTDLNGNDKNIILHRSNPLGLAVYGNYIYWSENNGNSSDIYRASKKNGQEAMKLSSHSETITDLSVFYSSKQSGTNQCASENGGCDNLCLALPDPERRDSLHPTSKFTCACPTHHTLKDKKCSPPTKFMVYSRRNLTVRLLPDKEDCPEAVLPVQGLRNVKAIEYDPLDNFVYWVDGKTYSIRRAHVSGLKMEVVVPQENKPYDLAIDVLGRLLFWTCTMQDVINVTSLNNTLPVGIVHHKEGEKPRLLAIHPIKRLLFYTDVSGTPKLVRIRLDGTHRINITVKANASDIVALAIDPENDLVVWAQGSYIYAANIDGDNQHTILTEHNSRISLLTVHLGWLYWLDRDLDELQRLVLKTGQSRSSVLSHASSIVDIVSVVPPDNNNPCFSMQQHCSHLCILNGTNAVCACLQGMKLLDDRRTCTDFLNCGKGHFTCSARSGKDCIPSSWRCDGEQDCPNGSDENGCQPCGTDQFKCMNGECIERSQVCDGKKHCSDGHDEDRCCKSPNEFKCPQTEVCILKSQLCDGEENCADGADEHKSQCPNLMGPPPKPEKGTTVIVVFTVISAGVGFSVIFYFLRRRFSISEVHMDQSEDPLSPMPIHTHIKPHKLRKGTIPDVVHMSMLKRNPPSSYDRSHITGASSSTNGSSFCSYPRETLNPPPSPATTRDSSPLSRFQPYRYYSSINQPPPPTPCSTDVCDESDYNYPTCRYDRGPFPPPPTPRSHCHSESCPPSPSSRSSTYFSPLPPPPSPVQSPRNYDS